jgi:GNAT superfamily N-acetyltransferase
MTIRRAHESEAVVLTVIAYEAKRHWGYPEHWIESWRSALTITPEFISKHEVFVAETANEIAGFYALVCTGDSRWELDDLFIRPIWIGHGLGRHLFEHAVGRLREIAPGSVLGIEADPNAESFYLHMGARRVGEIARNWQGLERVLPYLDHAQSGRTHVGF